MIKIMRGIPGSGKSFHAQGFYGDHDIGNAKIVSADRYFMRDGVYQFDPTRISLAHQECFRQFVDAAKQFRWIDLLIVDNTNVHLWECAPYVLAGEAFGHEVEMVYVRCDIEEAIARNTHGVPEAAIRRMAASFEEPLPFWSQRTIEN
jgi:NEDD4-binding protein 2